MRKTGRGLKTWQKLVIGLATILGILLAIIVGELPELIQLYLENNTN